MAIGKVNVSSGNNGKGEVLIEFNNYVSDNIIDGDNHKMVLELPIGSKYKFTEHEEEQVAEHSSILVNSPATGYIKPIKGVIFNIIPASILFGATEGDNTLHLRQQIGGFDCTIDWGDGSTTVAPVDGGEIVHSYTSAGDYNIQVKGKSFAGFCVGGSDGSEKYKALYSMGEWEIDTMTDMSFAFDSCTGLTEIPADLFKYNTLVTNMSSVFRSCEGLTEIPADLFKYNTLVTNMTSAFYGCSSLTTLPVELFMYNTKITMMSDVFDGCTGLIEIPIDLFKYNTSVANISYVFNGCSGLTTIPENLFKYNTDVIYASRAFYNCNKLTLRDDIFGEDYETRFNGKTVDFTKCFFRDEFNGIQGVAPRLWSFTGEIYPKTGCFGGTGNNATSLSNYADIPVDWK